MTTPPPDPLASAKGGPGYGPPAPYGSPGGYAPPPSPGSPGGPPQTHSKAIIALVLAIGSFVLFPLAPAIIALILASSASKEIAASGGRFGGDGMVTAAKVLSWLNIALCLIALLILVLVFGAFLSFFDSVSDLTPPTPVPG